MRSRFLPHIANLWIYLTTLAVLGILAVIVWAIPHGFDWTDEAWAYTLISNDRITVGEAWGFHYLLHPLFSATGGSVLAFRWFRLLGYLCVSGVLITVAWKISRAFRFRMGWRQWTMVAAASQVGTFLAWSYPPRYLSYNELSGWLSEVGAALLILAIATVVAPQPVLTRRSLALAWVGIGAIVVILCAAKAPSGIVFAVVALVVLFLRAPLRPLARSLIAVTGLVAGGLLLALLRFPFVAYVTSLGSLVFDKTAQDDYSHPVGSILSSYVVSFGLTASAIFVSVAICIGTIALLRLRASRLSSDSTGRAIGLISIGVALLCTIAIAQWRTSAPFTEIGRLLLFIGMVAALIAFVPLDFRKPATLLGGKQRLHIVIGWAVVVVTPFLAAVGTNNPITSQLLYSSTIWMVVVAFALVALSRHLAASAPVIAVVPLFLLTLVVGVSGLEVRADALYHPYRSVPYALQKTPADAPHLGGILLTRADARWAQWLAQQSKTLSAQKAPAISLASPGALLEFNASTFASPWIEDSWGVSFSSIRAACASGAPRSLFVLQPGTVAITDSVVTHTSTALASCGLHFPSDFTVVAQHRSKSPQDSIRIWRLKEQR